MNHGGHGEQSRHSCHQDLLPIRSPCPPWFDDALIERALAGEYQAFEQLVTRHSRRVFTLARHFFRNPEAVEEIAQQTFTRAFFSLASYRRGDTVERWLAGIAVKHCYVELCRRNRRGESLPAEVTSDEAAWLAGRLVGVPGEPERGRAAEIAEKLLSRLSPETRLLLVLLHAEDYSVREVAQLTGWSVAGVRLRVFRARHEVRRALGRLTLLAYPTRAIGRA